MSDEADEAPSGEPVAPVDDGWEPEPEPVSLSSRIGSGPVEYFRAVPARLFAWLGAVVFVGGWVAAVYVGVKGGTVGGTVDTPTSYKVQVTMSLGVQATIAAGILWAVAAFLWVRVLPALSEGDTAG
jgi:hypothetical protein